MYEFVKKLYDEYKNEDMCICRDSRRQINSTVEGGTDVFYGSDMCGKKSAK